MCIRDSIDSDNVLLENINNLSFTSTNAFMIPYYQDSFRMSASIHSSLLSSEFCDQFENLAWTDHILSYAGKTGLDGDYYLDSIPKLHASPDRCKGYIERWNKHKSYFFEKYTYLEK